LTEYAETAAYVDFSCCMPIAGKGASRDEASNASLKARIRKAEWKADARADCSLVSTIEDMAGKANVGTLSEKQARLSSAVSQL
jgi:hypothetical protein